METAMTFHELMGTIQRHPSFSRSDGLLWCSPTAIVPLHVVKSIQGCRPLLAASGLVAFQIPVDEGTATVTGTIHLEDDAPYLKQIHAMVKDSSTRAE
jgi:hypothetical protein